MKNMSGNYEGITCCICESDKTNKNFNNNPIWIREKNENGTYTGRRMCTGCYGKIKKKVPGRICYICDTDETIHWHSDHDEKGFSTGKWLCNKCFKNLPGNYNDIVKSMTQSRNKQLSRYSSKGIGFIGEMIVSTTLGLYNCNLIMDNFNFPIDLYSHEKYGKIQVKTKQPYYGDWAAKCIKYPFDTLFVVCMDKGMKNVERVYAIPEEELGHVTGVSILKNNNSKWEKFRINEKSYNDTYHKMDIGRCPVLKNE